MKHFTKIAEGFDVMPALREVARCGLPAWIPMQERPNFENWVAKGYPINRKDPSPPGSCSGDILTGGQWLCSLPGLQTITQQVLDAVGNPGPSSASVRSLPPHSPIKPHRDNFDDLHAARLHLMLQSDARMVFQIKREKCRMMPRELWLTDIQGHTHSVDNRSDLQRINMVFDVPMLPKQLRAAKAHTRQ